MKESVMNCNDKDLLLYLEGRASKEAEMHIETCGECREALKGLFVFRKTLPFYREGRKLLESLDEHMKSFDGQKVRHLPPRIEEMLGAAAGEKPEGGEGTVRPFRRPEKTETLPEEESRGVRLAAAAIPRDITKPRKRRSKPEGGNKEEKK
jgi:hypothetical protein